MNKREKSSQNRRFIRLSCAMRKTVGFSHEPEATNEV